MVILKGIHSWSGLMKENLYAGKGKGRNGRYQPRFWSTTPLLALVSHSLFSNSQKVFLCASTISTKEQVCWNPFHYLDGLFAGLKNCRGVLPTSMHLDALQRNVAVHCTRDSFRLAGSWWSSNSGNASMLDHKPNNSLGIESIKARWVLSTIAMWKDGKKLGLKQLFDFQLKAQSSLPELGTSGNSFPKTSQCSVALLVGKNTCLEISVLQTNCRVWPEGTETRSFCRSRSFAWIFSHSPVLDRHKLCLLLYNIQL